MISEVLGKIGELIMQVPPIAVLDPDEGGVMLRLGKFHKRLSGGHYWKIPFIDVVRKTWISEQTIDLPVQTVGNNDGQTITCSGYIRYKVTDASKALLELYDYDLSLPRQAMAEIASVVGSHSFMAQSEVEKAVEESLDNFEKCGIDVMDFALTDYCVTLGLRIIQN